jgi:hypothetical protein
MSAECQKRTHALQQSTSAASSESGNLIAGHGLSLETLRVESCLTAVMIVTGGLAVVNYPHAALASGRKEADGRAQPELLVPPLASVMTELIRSRAAAGMTPPSEILSL